MIITKVHFKSLQLTMAAMLSIKYHASQYKVSSRNTILFSYPPKIFLGCLANPTERCTYVCFIYVAVTLKKKNISFKT